MRTLAMVSADGASSRLSVLAQKQSEPVGSLASTYRITDLYSSNCADTGSDAASVCIRLRPRPPDQRIHSSWPRDLDRSTGEIPVET